MGGGGRLQKWWDTLRERRLKVSGRGGTVIKREQGTEWDGRRGKEIAGMVAGMVGGMKREGVRDFRVRKRACSGLWGEGGRGWHWIGHGRRGQ